MTTASDIRNGSGADSDWDWDLLASIDHLIDRSPTSETSHAVRSAPTVSPDVFREAMGSLAGSPLLVSAWVDGRPWSMTVSAFCAISATPPLVMVSLTNTTKVCQQILTTRRFGISALSADQEDLARRCGTPGASKFVDDFCIEPGPGGAHGEPAIRDAVFNLACTAVQIVPVADHVLIIGSIRQAQLRGDDTATPLIYHDRNYWTLSRNGE